MPRSPDAPAALLMGPFTVAEARRHGVTQRMLQGAAWHSLTRGVHCHRTLVVDDHVRVSALRLALPDHAVATGLLAAWALGAWRPAHGRPLPLDWAVLREEHRPRGPAARSHRLVIGAADVVERNGLLCTSPQRTLFDIMRRACLVEAVVAADAFAGRGLVDLPHVYGYVDGHRRWPGVELVRRRLEHATRHARSPGETRLRMVAVLGGLPEPYVNVPMYRGEELLAVPDLLLEGRRWAVAEYDGQHHEHEEQHVRDLRRENRLSVVAGVPVLRFDRHSLSRHALREKVLAELAAAIDVRPAGGLRPLWFADPRRPLRW
ncbi:DUF559 domain-containing protein [Angustibacter peucedani]